MDSVGDLIQPGARQIIQRAIEAERAILPEQYENVKTPDDKCAVERNGFLIGHGGRQDYWESNDFRVGMLLDMK